MEGSTLVRMAPGVPQLLERLRAGDESALNELVTALYGELRRIAARQLRGERPCHTLQTTGLVHEAYLKLLGDNQRGFSDRVHFLAVASRVMRQVLVDYARARATKKREPARMRRIGRNRIGNIWSGRPRASSNGRPRLAPSRRGW